MSPRGTLEVLDDYPYWVAKKFGYFGDIETTLEPGPLDATACVKLVDQNQADMGYPSPGVFSLGLAQGMPLVSVFEMGAADVFDFAFRKGEAPKDLKDLKGKTIALGSAGWQAICDPMLQAAGVDIRSRSNMSRPATSWGTAVAQNKADAALSWEGLRAQWKGQGLDFDYLIGRNFSKLPANSFVIRKADFEDAAKKDLYARYLRGWAMGLEFGHLNPRAATHIAMQQFPGLATQMKPPVATESMMQLANVFRGDFADRKGWGWHDEAAWNLFFKTDQGHRPDHRRTSRRPTWSRTTTSPAPTISTRPRSRPTPTATSCPTTTPASTSRRSARGCKQELTRLCRRGEEKPPLLSHHMMPAAVGISLRRTATLKDARSAIVAAAGANAGGVAAAAAARASRGPIAARMRGADGSR